MIPYKDKFFLFKCDDYYIKYDVKRSILNKIYSMIIQYFQQK